MKYHDNEVKLVYNEGNGYKLTKKGSFLIKDFSVTDGQDPDGNISKNRSVAVNTDGTIVFRVGRKKSKKVAEWWISKVPADKNTYNSNPDELNFAMIGVLTLYIKGGIFGDKETKLVFENVAFAQGSYAGRNNWWFGGSEAYFVSNENPLSLEDEAVLMYGTFTEEGKTYYAKTKALRSELGVTVNTITINHSQKVDASNASWIQERNSKQPCKLKDLVMPGSHDAGMSELHHITAIAAFNTGAVQTQSVCVFEQMVYGCRYFDIRVDYDHDKLVTYHRSEDGIGANGQPISHVLDQASSFLRNYQKEFIILKMSHIRSDSGHDPDEIIKKLKQLLSKYKNCFLLSQENEKLKLHELACDSLSGKILVVCDFNNVASSDGLYRYRDVETLDKPISSDFNELNVFDRYSNTPEYSIMSEDQLRKWKSSNDLVGSDHLFLLSWTLTLSSWLDNIFGTIYDLAKEANQNLDGFLKSNSGLASPNIIYVDYIDKAVCDVIISRNEISK